MVTIRELMADEQGVVTPRGLVVVMLLGALVILGVWEFADSVVDIHDRALRGLMRA